MPGSQLVSHLLACPPSGWVFSTGLPAYLDEELQTTLQDLRHQISQSKGGKGSLKALQDGGSPTSSPHPQYQAPELSNLTNSCGYALLGENNDASLFDYFDGPEGTEVDTDELPTSWESKVSACLAFY